jgi:predicted nuclease of predicted toxin-antitoxin system
LKLLFDQNLSPRLVKALSDLFPDAQHVFQLGLAEQGDSAIWEYAKLNGLTIVSKDSDFVLQSLLYGAPPKVIHLQVGNCPTSAIEKLLRDNLDLIHELDESGEKTCLTIPA